MKTRSPLPSTRYWRVRMMRTGELARRHHPHAGQVARQDRVFQPRVADRLDIELHDHAAAMIAPHRDAILIRKVVGRKTKRCQVRLIHQLIVHPCCLAWVSASRRVQNRDISTNLTNGRVICRRSSPRMALKRCLPRRPGTSSAKTFVALPSLVARCQQNTHPPNGGGVGLWRPSA